MWSCVSGTLIQYYSEKLTAERDSAIHKMKYAVLFERLQKKKQKEENKEKELYKNLLVEIQKLINDENEKLNTNIRDEIIDFKNEIKSNKETNVTLIQNIIYNNNTIKCEIQLLKQEMAIMNQNLIDETNILKNGIQSNTEVNETLNENIIDDNNSMKCEIKLLKEGIAKLNQNIIALKKQINAKSEDVNNEPIDKDGTRDIWEASSKGSLPGVKYHYTGNPSYLNQKNNFHYTPLHCASREGHLEIVKFLLSKEVEVDSLTYDNETPLMLASRNGHLSVINLLLDEGANVNHQDRDKETSLHMAVRGDHFYAVKLLIEKGADKMIKNNHNQISLGWAKFLRNRTSIVNYLSSL